MIDQLNLFSNELTDYEDTLPENNENDKLLEQYEETKTEAKATLIKLQQVISQKEAEQEEKEKQLQLVQRGKEKQLQIEQRNRKKQMEINAEIEKDNLRSQERIELERFNLEKAKLELEAKTNIERVKMELKVKETELEKEMATAGKADIPKMKTNIRLSKLEFKKFNGDTLKWQEFWDSFEATIHKDPTMSPINKFNYLRTQLEDRVLKIIEELELTNANYETAITLLQEHYGKKQMVLDAHYTHLMDLAQASNNTSSFRVTYDAVETHLRSLQSLGENIHHRQIISIVRTKLPKVVIARLEQQKDPDEESR